jgi:hypothetical protein
MRIVPIGELADAWEECAPWISAAIEQAQGDESLTDVLIALARGVCSLWHEPGSFAAITQTARMPRQSVCTVLYAGGDLQSLSDGLPVLRAWCREHGVEVLRVWGREGWQRQLNLKRVGVILQEDV